MKVSVSEKKVLTTLDLDKKEHEDYPCWEMLDITKDKKYAIAMTYENWYKINLEGPMKIEGKCSSDDGSSPDYL